MHVCICGKYMMYMWQRPWDLVECVDWGDKGGHGWDGAGVGVRQYRDKGSRKGGLDWPRLLWGSCWGWVTLRHVCLGYYTLLVPLWLVPGGVVLLIRVAGGLLPRGRRAPLCWPTLCLPGWACGLFPGGWPGISSILWGCLVAAASGDCSGCPGCQDRFSMTVTLLGCSDTAILKSCMFILVVHFLDTIHSFYTILLGHKTRHS